MKYENLLTRGLIIRLVIYGLNIGKQTLTALRF
jgi:hypothetical protein